MKEKTLFGSQEVVICIVIYGILANASWLSRVFPILPYLFLWAESKA